MPFLLPTVESLRRIFALQEWRTLRTDAGSSRTCPGTGTDTRRRKTVIGTKNWNRHWIQDLKGGRIDRQISHICWTLPRPCHLFIYPINAVTIPVSVSTQQMEHDAGRDRRRLCFTHPSILKDNEENGRPPVCPLTDACTNIDLSIKVSLILFKTNF